MMTLSIDNRELFLSDYQDAVVESNLVHLSEIEKENNIYYEYFLLSSIFPKDRKFTVCLMGDFADCYPKVLFAQSIIDSLRKNSDTVYIKTIRKDGIFIEKNRDLIIENDFCDYDISIYIDDFHLIKKNTMRDNSVTVFFPWDVTKLCVSDLYVINESYNVVFCHSNLEKKYLIENGCSIPIVVTRLGLAFYLYRANHYNLPNSRLIRFLSVSTCSDYSDIELLLNVYKELSASNKTRVFNLTIIVNCTDRLKRIYSIIQNRLNKELSDNVNVVSGLVSKMDYLPYYEKSDIFLLPCPQKNEFIHFIQGLLLGKIVIINGSYEMRDYFKGYPFFINYCFSVLSDFHSMNLYRTYLFKQSIFNCIQNALNLTKESYEFYIKKFQYIINTKFCMEFYWYIHFYFKYVKKYFDNSSCKKLSVDLVSTWDSKCGIAEHSKSLVNNSALCFVVKKIDNYHNSSVCKFNSEQFLSDVTWFQYHPAFFKIDLNFYLFINKLKIKNTFLVITLHSCKPLVHSSFDHYLLVEVLMKFDIIFVHSVSDMNVLRVFGIENNVFYIPLSFPKRVWSPYNVKIKSSFKIGYFGFLLNNKGVLSLIKGFEKFVSKYSDSRLTILSSLREDIPESVELNKICLSTINDNNMGDKVNYITQFLPESSIREYLSNCDLIILPYQQTVEPVSASARMAMSCCPRVVITNSFIFKDIQRYCYVLNDSSSDGICDFLLKYVSGEVEQWIDEESLSFLIDQYDTEHVAELAERIVSSVYYDANFLSSLRKNIIR